MRLRIGTRGSLLARWQANWTAERLRGLGAQVELVEITTRGDQQTDGPVASLGIQGVFTKELQTAQLDGRVDLAVHSLKDLPTAAVEGLAIAAIAQRADPSDALITEAGSLDALPPGSRIGTGSLRRKAQLLALRDDLEVLGIRGNVDTRLKKLDAGHYDAILLATAGLTRLGLDHRIAETLGPPRMLPAPGQGALALECRADDRATREVLEQLHDAAAAAGVAAERSMLATLEGGCSAPIAAWGRVEADVLQLDGLVASPTGKPVLRAAAEGLTEAPEQLGQQVAAMLLEQGAAKLVSG